ncbi:hypothetical protein AJ88_43260 [Mesorhizobium amorphae CCBAU 01583]|nr:hypothetical protein AJ88_43260 [Mesorhizobium amorphae CCBAU 01583]
MNIIPSTIVGAFAQGDILQVLFFSVLFGIALAMVGETGKPVVCFLQALIAPIFKLVSLLMKAAPIGAFGAMAFTTGKYGIGSIVNLAMLVATFYFTAFLFVFGVLGAVCRYNGFSIFSLLRYIKEELRLSWQRPPRRPRCPRSWRRWRRPAPSVRSWVSSSRPDIPSIWTAPIST